MSITNEKIQEVLTNAITIFSETASESIGAFFGKSAKVETSWSSNKHIEIDCRYILVMGGASNNFQSILTVGVDLEAILELAGQILEQNEFCDVFGELANTYWGMLMDRKEFTAHFGILNQTVPLIYTKGIPFLPFLSGVQGSVVVNNKPVTIGFAIRKK